jgi:subtilisin family serine protease
VAKTAKYSFYAEPDFIRIRSAPYSEQPTQGLNPVWPPSGPVNPGWHLLNAFTGALSARVKGAGVKIAHVDTGYSDHDSKPLNLRPDLGWNFYEGNSNSLDPGTNFGWPPPTPGHGTATLALLAGNKLDMTFAGHRFDDYFGIAPESEVIPVRIGASVIHFGDSAMAQGIDYALAPRGNSANRCDVITLSHGGFPSLSWAYAVNAVYDAGVVLAAAAGDNEILLFLDIPGHDTIWPSRFRRAITVTGATYDKLPYVTDDWLQLQGSYGPDSIMDKAIASYAPNTAWMEFGTARGYDMNGGGTSASTPQIAAACALWLQENKSKYPANWRRVEACRQALFNGADKAHNDYPTGNKNSDGYFGQGLLRVPNMLDVVVNAAELTEEPPDTVSSVAWRGAMGLDAANNNEELMYEVEAAQIVARSRSPDLVASIRNVESEVLSTSRRMEMRQFLVSEPDVSQAFKQRVARG